VNVEITMVKCPECKAVVKPRHVHSSPYGFTGAHMAGTERFVCPECEYWLTREEAEDRGLVYVLDTKP